MMSEIRNMVRASRQVKENRMAGAVHLLEFDFWTKECLTRDGERFPAIAMNYVGRCCEAFEGFGSWPEAQLLSFVALFCLHICSLYTGSERRQQHSHTANQETKQQAVLRKCSTFGV